MINFDGHCYSNFNDVPQGLLSRLTQLPVHTQHLLSFKGKISLLEAQYFSIMAALRRYRVDIPMHYSLTYFQEQAVALQKYTQDSSDFQGISIKFYRKEKPSLDTIITPICFVLQFQNVPWNTVETKNLTLYKDHYIGAAAYSNLFQTNAALRNLSQVFAYENGYGAALLLNHHKRLADSSNGAVFLVNKENIQTPALPEGAQNTVIRKCLIDFIAKESKLEIIEDEIPTFSVQQAHEIFLVSEEYGWTQIEQFRKKKFDSAVSEPLRLKFTDQLVNQL